MPAGHEGQQHTVTRCDLANIGVHTFDGAYTYVAADSREWWRQQAGPDHEVRVADPEPTMRTRTSSSLGYSSSRRSGTKTAPAWETTAAVICIVGLLART